MKKNKKFICNIIFNIIAMILLLNNCSSVKNKEMISSQNEGEESAVGEGPAAETVGEGPAAETVGEGSAAGTSEAVAAGTSEAVEAGKKEEEKKFVVVCTLFRVKEGMGNEFFWIASPIIESIKDRVAQEKSSLIGEDSLLVYPKLSSKLKLIDGYIPAITVSLFKNDDKYKEWRKEHGEKMRKNEKLKKFYFQGDKKPIVIKEIEKTASEKIDLKKEFKDFCLEELGDKDFYN